MGQIGEGHIPEILHAHFNDLRLPIENGDDLRRKQLHQCKNHRLAN